MARRLAGLLSLTLALMLSASCVVVTSQYPASKAHDSRLDDELVGWWSLRAAAEMTPEEAEGTEVADRGVRLLVGRDEDGSRLEWLLVHLAQGDRIEMLRGAFRVTGLGERWIVSRYPEGDGNDWWLSRVRLMADGPVGYDDLNPEPVAGSIEAGEIEGSVERAEDGQLSRVRLAADTPALRDWIRSQGDSIWQDSGLRWARDPVPPYHGR